MSTDQHPKDFNTSLYTNSKVSLRSGLIYYSSVLYMRLHDVSVSHYRTTPRPSTSRVAAHSLAMPPAPPLARRSGSIWGSGWTRTWTASRQFVPRELPPTAQLRLPPGTLTLFQLASVPSLKRNPAHNGERSAPPVRPRRSPPQARRPLFTQISLRTGPGALCLQIPVPMLSVIQPLIPGTSSIKRRMSQSRVQTPVVLRLYLSTYIEAISYKIVWTYWICGECCR